MLFLRGLGVWAFGFRRSEIVERGLLCKVSAFRFRGLGFKVSVFGFGGFGLRVSRFALPSMSILGQHPSERQMSQLCSSYVI